MALVWKESRVSTHYSHMKVKLLLRVPYRLMVTGQNTARHRGEWFLSLQKHKTLWPVPPDPIWVHWAPRPSHFGQLSLPGSCSTLFFLNALFPLILHPALPSHRRLWYHLDYSVHLLSTQMWLLAGVGIDSHLTYDQVQWWELWLALELAQGTW